MDYAINADLQMRDKVHPAVKLSVVVPLYNEQEVLAELYRRLAAASVATAADDYEIVFVDDGSSDETWPKLVGFASTDPHLAAVRLSRNHGHQLALTAGLTFCRGQRILIIDADLQDPPELLPLMMKLMDEGCDVVYGCRIERQGESHFKRASASLFYRILGLLGDIHIPKDTGDFRLISRRALDILNSMPEQQRFIRGMVSWIGLKQVPIAYRREPRLAGQSKYPTRKMVKFALDAVTSFSIRPLRLASFLGMICGGLALIGMIYVARAWMIGEAVPGWASLSAMVLVLSSAQLLVLGIIGEYLGRLFVEAKRRPLFIVEEVYKLSEVQSQDVLREISNC